MSDKFEFIGANDKPALLAFSTPEWMEAARTAQHPYNPGLMLEALMAQAQQALR
mgnify:CR=1 FL=1